MMHKLILGLLLSASTALVMAAETIPQDYAYGMTLETPERAAFYQLALPLEVYRAVVHKDLRDLRVFNAAGEEVPTLLRTEQSHKQDKTLQLPIYPLPRGEGEAGSAPRIHVVTGKDGTIVDISDKQAQGKTSKDVYYIIDASRVEGTLRSLKLSWKTIPAGKIIAMQLSYSNDLHNWTALEEASLSYLQFNGQQLYQDEIQLPTFHGRYLRLLPTEHLNQRLASVEARVSHTRISTTPSRSLTLKTSLDMQASAFVVDAGAALPITTLNIDLQQDNAVVDYALYARASETDEWRSLGTHSFYHYTIDNRQTRNPAYNIHGHLWRYFKLEPTQKSGPKQLPTVELSWTPHQLIFMGQGQGPFQLVYGRGDSTASADQSLAKLLATIKPVDHEHEHEHSDDEHAIVMAGTGTQYLLCGEACLRMAEAPVDYLKYLLWGVIVLGSLLVGWMVVRLSGEMKVD